MKIKIFMLVALISFSTFIGCKSTHQKDGQSIEDKDIIKNSINLSEENSEFPTQLKNLNEKNEEKTQIMNEDNTSQKELEIQTENTKMTDEIKLLKENIKNLEILNKELSNKYERQKKLYEENMDYKIYQAAYSFLKVNLSYWSTYKEVISNNINNVFHPLLIDIGDKVAGLELLEIVEDELYCRELRFSGKFKVKLKIYKDTSYDKIKFEVTNDYSDKITTDIFTYSKNISMDYNLGTSGEELIKQIGDSYYEGIVATVILDNYSIVYDEVNFNNRAEFIELISIDNEKK